MKIDRFVKSMLMLIALFLALSCVNDLKLSSNSVEAAAPPSFLQVGKSYAFYPPPLPISSGVRSAKVLEIQNTGWVKVQPNEGNTTFWVNTNACVAIDPD
jgi:hypothetical protein